jgi:hypothetical protein
MDIFRQVLIGFQPDTKQSPPADLVQDLSETASLPIDKGLHTFNHSHGLKNNLPVFEHSTLHAAPKGKFHLASNISPTDH